MHRDGPRLYERALALAGDRRYREADAALTEAAAAATDDDLRARIAGTHAYVLDQLGRADDAEQLCRETLAREGLTAHTRGVVAGQLGTILLHRGRLTEASEWLGEAIGSITDDAGAVANLRVNRSVVSMQLRDLPAAFDDLERAVAAFASQGSEIGVAEARHNLGYTALLGGDLIRAIREMSAARPVIAGASAANAAIGDVDMAEALRDAGLVTQAETLLRAAADAFRDNGMPQAGAEAELQLARSLLRHDPPAAAEVADAAARSFAAVGAGSWADRADGIRLRALLSGGAVDRAGRTVADRAGADLEADVARVTDALDIAGLAGEADALRLTHELWRARRGAGSSAPLPPVGENAPLEVRLLAHEVRAERARWVGQPADSRGHAAAGLDELSAWRSSFGSLDLQSSLAMHGSTLVLAGVAAAVDSGDPGLVFEWSERARHLSLQVTPLRPPADPEQAAELSELRMLRADAAGADWTNDPRAIELGERLRRRQWTTTGAAEVERRVELGEASAALDADTALVSFVFTGESLACVVATATDARVVELTDVEAARRELAALRSDLDVSAAVRSGPMAAVVRRSLKDRLARLSEMLLERPLAGVDAPRVVLTAPGVLAGLPWTMLPVLDGRAVTLAASASRWVRGRGGVGGSADTDGAGARRADGWGADSAPAGSARAVSAGATAVFAVGPRVARGEEEAAAGAAHWSEARVLARQSATVDAVTDAAHGASILHIAAHGRHALDNSLFSGLELSDGALFGYDIDRMPRVPGVIVLSACEAGRSAVRWGEEAVGMTRAWLHAGADAVIAAPVIVADDDACELLGAVHAGLAGGQPPAVALAAASSRTGIRSAFLCHGNGF